MDITYYIGFKSYVIYKNIVYSSINELIESVKEIGIRFYKVYLVINLVFLND